MPEIIVLLEDDERDVINPLCMVPKQSSLRALDVDLDNYGSQPFVPGE